MLCHDLYESTATAMDRVIPELIAQGYQLVTVSELLSYWDGGAVPRHPLQPALRLWGDSPFRNPHSCPPPPVPPAGATDTLLSPSPAFGKASGGNQFSCI